jgi:RNA-directed DNA polymerase
MRHNTHAKSEGRERNSREYGEVRHADAAARGTCHPEAECLMEAVVEHENMRAALRQVRKNGGAPGVDGMTVGELGPWLKTHWSRVKAELLEGRYKPQPVRRVEIPKRSGKGMRQLGIPTVLDRLIQQAVHQVLQPIFDPDFSERSYGFRPNRSAQMAVQQARSYVAEGKRWVVDIDLENFFDRVNHDILMSRVARKVRDKRVLRLIGRYLRAGVLASGVVSLAREGTPQGGPLSPLLSNIVLDDLDKELEKRGHSFVRYADDCNIYVRSRRSGERVLGSITRFLEGKLKLKVHRGKSAVDRPWKRKFLGYSMTWHKPPRLKVARESVKRLKGDLKKSFRAGRGRNLSRFITEELNAKLRGWVNYFGHSEVKGIFEELDGWIRRRLRNIIWRQWKRPRTRARKLMQRGLDEERAWRSAYNGRGPWWNSGASHMNAAFPNRYFDGLGLVSLSAGVLRFQTGS